MKTKHPPHSHTHAHIHTSKVTLYLRELAPDGLDHLRERLRDVQVGLGTRLHSGTVARGSEFAGSLHAHL